MLEAYSFDGQKSAVIIVKDIKPLYYDTKMTDEDGRKTFARCTLSGYWVADGYMGLCDESGQLVTEPLYAGIEGVYKDLYLCEYKDSGNRVFVNSKGKVVEASHKL